MMFREKGNRIQCLRSGYLPEKKRTQAKMVCSLDSWSKTVPEEVSQLLTKEEVDSLNEYLSSRHEKMAVDKLTMRLRFAGEAIDEISSALQCEALDNDKVLSADEGAALFAKIAELRKQLKRAGYRPAAPEKTKKAKKAKNQTEMQV